MAHHTVQVTIQGRSITVDQETVRIHENSSLQWSGNEPFSIKFDDPGPFGAQLTHAAAQQARQPNQGHHGRFKYTIILDRDNSIELDPVVIVDPGKTFP